MRRWLYPAFFLLLMTPLFAQARHPFTFEDMMKLKRIEEPEVSPDGKWVLFAAVEVDLAANTKTPHIWVVPLSNSNGAAGVPHPSPVLARVGGNEKADSSTAAKNSHADPSSSAGMTTEREIISDQDADRPRWAPDGKRFAFISTKHGGSQIWVANFDGATGTVTGVGQLTDIKTEADGELWSPDGKNILFRSDVYPECDGAPNEEDCNAKKLAAVEKSPVKAQIFTHLLYRHWNAYKEGKRSHLFVVSAPLPPWGGSLGDHAASIPRDLTPGDYDAPPFSLGGQDDYAFSPDGQEICYASNHDAMPADSTNNDLFTVPVNFPADATSVQVLAATKNITADNKASDETPLYSPGGKYIAYRAQQRPGYESDRFRLMLYDRKTGEKKNLTEDFDESVGSYTWGASRFLFFVAENEGSARVYYTSLDMVEPTVMKTALQGYDDNLAFVESSNKAFLLLTKMSIAAPQEIYWSPAMTILTPRCGETGGDICTSQDLHFQITHLNESLLSQISMSPLEPFWFTGAHGDKVEGFLVKPPNFDPNRKYPVKFLIHGGPQGAWGDDWSYRWNPELFASPTSSTSGGYVVLMINFHGSTGYGQKFIDAINGDWGGAPLEDLMKGLDYAEAHYGFIDKDRECALGASYGGYMANWILGHTNRFKCIVSHDGMYDAEAAWGSTEELWFNEWEFKGTPWANREMYRKWSPSEYAANFKTPTLVIHGQKDYRLDVSQGFELFTTLQRLGVPSKMLYFPDEGHWVLKPQNSQLWYKTVNDWVDQWIGDQRPEK